jgi:exosortase
VNYGMQDIAIQAPIAGVKRSPQWLAPWQAIVLVGLIAVLYRSILWKLVGHWWMDPNFSHGFFVPLFSAFVVWREREELAQVPVRPSMTGLVIIGAALLALVVGVLGAELFLSRSSLILLIGGLVIYFAGWRFFRAILFPWLFLFLMVPIPAIVFNQITLPLQFFASQVAAGILRLLGVPVLREGNIIMLPSMPLEVAEACSGIRSLMSLGTMAIIYGYFADTKLWRRVVLALVAVPIAIAANALRIVGTGLTVQYWDPDKGQGFFHEFSGWLIFVASLTMLLAVHQILRRVGDSNVRNVP